MEDRVTYFGETNARGKKKKFGIKKKDRRYHMYAIGKTGMGKSTLLLNLVRQDIENGEGVALLDPHGDLAEKVLELLPDERKKDLVYLDVARRDNPLTFNPLEV